MTRSRLAWRWVGLAVVAIAIALDLWIDRGHDGIDFHTYLAAAVVGFQHGWQHIYDQALVAVAQEQLVPTLKSQPFISPMTVAWVVAPLVVFPYWTAYWVWMGFTFMALAAAFAWAGVSTGTSRWIGVVGALAPWWVLYAVNLGQVVPLVAAGVVVAWRLLRDGRQVAAGLVLSLIFLKPNTAFLVPLALLVAGQARAFAAWLAAGVVLILLAAVIIGGEGTSAYTNQLLGPLPSGADYLTLKGVVGVTGAVASILRVLIVGIVLAAAFKLRSTPALVVPVGVLGSMILSPYLHASDLCLFSAAAWIVWEERPAPEWRVPLAFGWVLASPYLAVAGLSPPLHRVPVLEYFLLLALVAVAWRPLTSAADLRTRAPA